MPRSVSMQKLHEEKWYWFYWLMESKRRIELSIDLLIYSFIATFICLVAYFLKWEFFLHGILDYVIYFLLITLCIIPCIIYSILSQEEKANERYQHFSMLLKEEENLSENDQ